MTTFSSTVHPLYERIHTHYDSIEANVKKHTKLPSFFAKSTGKAQQIEMTWTGSEYKAELTDTNGVLGNYTFTANVTGMPPASLTSSASGSVFPLTASASTSCRSG